MPAPQTSPADSKNTTPAALSAAAVAAAVGASTPDCWWLKGEGNANIVLGYNGSDPLLKGTVLRLRKTPKHTRKQQRQPPHQQLRQQQRCTSTNSTNSIGSGNGNDSSGVPALDHASQHQQTPATGTAAPDAPPPAAADVGAAHAGLDAAAAAVDAAAAAVDAAAAAVDAAAAAHAALEAAVWQPVIPDWHTLDSMQRELAYVQRVLAPHFAAAAADASTAAANGAAASSSAANTSASWQLSNGSSSSSSGGGGREDGDSAQHDNISRACQLAVASAQMVAPPPQLLSVLQSSGGHDLQGGVMGLLMQDSSVLRPESLPPGVTPVGPCLCVEIKPKSGVMPHQPGAAAATTGGEAAAAVPPDSIKRQHPRFVLHQLLKHKQGKAPQKSFYNPMDLFMTSQTTTAAATETTAAAPTETAAAETETGAGAGAGAGAETAAVGAAAAVGASSLQLLRQQAAVLALLECPSNNLKVFVDGVMVLGSNKLKTATNTPRVTACTGAASSSSSGGGGGGESADERRQQQQQRASPAAAAAAILQAARDTTTTTTTTGNSSSGSSGGGGGGGGNNSSSSSSGGGGGGNNNSSSSSGSRSRAALRAQSFGRLLTQLPDSMFAHEHILGNPAASTPAALAEQPAAEALTAAATAALVEQPAATPAALAEQPESAAAAADRERLLCRVLCGVLNASGVLRALLELQQLDAVDVQGIEPLYAQLLLQQQQQYNQQHQEEEEEEQEEQHQEEQQQRQFEQLRNYLTAATAKDCAVMLTLQQVVPAAPNNRSAANTSVTSSSSRSSSRGGVGGNSAEQQQPQPPSQSLSPAAAAAAARAAQLHTDAATGCCFAWQLSVVDLDLKPVSKVPVHADLDRAIVAAAAAHAQLLQQHLADQRQWVEAAVGWLAAGLV